MRFADLRRRFRGSRWVRSAIFLVAAAGVVGFSMLGAIELMPVASALLTAAVMVPALAVGARVQARLDGTASHGSDGEYGESR